MGIFAFSVIALLAAQVLNFWLQIDCFAFSAGAEFSVAD